MHKASVPAYIPAEGVEAKQKRGEGGKEGGREGGREEEGERNPDERIFNISIDVQPCHISRLNSHPLLSSIPHSLRLSSLTYRHQSTPRRNCEAP